MLVNGFANERHTLIVSKQSDYRLWTCCACATMAFSFGFGGDDLAVDAAREDRGSAPALPQMPAKQHDLEDLVGKALSPFLRRSAGNLLSCLMESTLTLPIAVIVA